MPLRPWPPLSLLRCPILRARHPRRRVAYEGVRLIVGDGRVADNATLVVDGARIVQAGAGVSVPAGATRVNLAGKTAMPTIIDTHVHLSATRERLIRDLKQRGYWGVGAAMSMGTDNLELLPMRNEVIPGAARFLSAGRGITRKEPMRPTHQIETEDEGRKAVRDNAALGVRSSRSGSTTARARSRRSRLRNMPPSSTRRTRPALRVTAHIFNMDDAKGLMRANLDAFAHGVRDKDVDDETVAMFKARPNLVLTPNLPERGVKVDRSWMQAGMPADEFAKLEETNIDRPGGADLPRHPGAQSGEDECGGRADRDGHRRQPAVGRARGDGGHGAGRHDAGAGDRGIDPQRRRIPAARRRGHAARPARAPTSSCSTQIRWTTSRTRARSRRSICAARRWTGRSRFNDARRHAALAGEGRCRTAIIALTGAIRFTRLARIKQSDARDEIRTVRQRAGATRRPRPRQRSGLSGIHRLQRRGRGAGLRPASSWSSTISPASARSRRASTC